MINKTKIIATIGPSTNQPHIIAKLIKTGVNLFRINMAHAINENDTKQIVKLIRSEAKKNDKHIGVLMDIAGPKIRVDLRKKNIGEVKVFKGKSYILGYSGKNDIPINMKIKFSNSKIDNALVKIDDGNINFKILSIQNNKLKLKAINSGLITLNKGVNFPGLRLNIPSVTNKDKKDIKLGIKLKIDWFSLSFVRSSDDIKPFLNFYRKNKIFIPVIAKIEKPEAIDNLDEIIETYSGVLIARGDLGVEMPITYLPILQKKIVKKCRTKKKPVIIATQMLDSMTTNLTPTRAEVSDVANSVYQGVDAVMLSGETAIGKHPIETIKMMSEIVSNVEKEMLIKKTNKMNIITDKDYRSAIGEAVKTISEHLNIDSIVVMTESGSTARIVSHFRTKVNIFALSPSEHICNRMSLLFGVIPIVTKEFSSTDEMLLHAEKILLKKKHIKNGQIFIMTAGVPVGVSGSTNMLKIQHIADK